MKPDPNQPLWFLGPSYNLHSYKDFITQHLPPDNVLTIANVFFYLKILWNYQPKFFTWVDPHQTFCMYELFDKISPLLSTPSTYITYPFNPDRETFFKYFKSSGYVTQKGFSQYSRFRKLLKDHPLLNEEYCDMQHQKYYGEEIGQRLFSDPEFKFNIFKKPVLGTQPRQLENLITKLAFPLCQYYNIKTLFVLGFDDHRKRFYSKGQTGRLNKIHYQYRCLKEWVSWFDFHKIKIYNLQKESPLSKHIETITPMESLSFLQS